MKRLLTSIAFAVGIYVFAGVILLIIASIDDSGPRITFFDNPLGFYSIFVAVFAIAAGVWIYWRVLDPNRAARMAQDRLNRQK